MSFELWMGVWEETGAIVYWYGDMMGPMVDLTRHQIYVSAIGQSNDPGSMKKNSKLDG